MFYDKIGKIQLILQSVLKVLEKESTGLYYKKYAEKKGSFIGFWKIQEMIENTRKNPEELKNDFEDSALCSSE